MTTTRLLLPSHYHGRLTTRFWKQDVPAGMVVFLVALPLCLGLALASGAPPISGVIAGMIGGLIVPLISHSELGVSGPANSLTAILAASSAQLGGFEMLLVAIIIAGLIQIIMGTLRMGVIVVLFPHAVVRGMLSAIGIMLIVKQLPHALGYAGSGDDIGNVGGVIGIFDQVRHAFDQFHPGSVLICLLGLGVIFLWEKTKLHKIPWLPGPLIVAGIGIIANRLLALWQPSWTLMGPKLVSLPISNNPMALFNELATPNWIALKNPAVYSIGLTMAIIASLETLLSVEAVDSLDPWQRRSPSNRELIAQGVGNMVSGVMGAIPITSVIVRSSANIEAGGHTRLSSMIHGAMLFVSVLFMAPILNQLPLAALAAILLVVGFKLAHPKIFVGMYRAGWDQFGPFIATLIVILFTDLLKGIIFGVCMGIVIVLKNNMRDSFDVIVDENRTIVRLQQSVSFLDKYNLAKLFDTFSEGTHVLVDGSLADFIDHDIRLMIYGFEKASPVTGVSVEVHDIDLSDVRNEM